MADLLVGGRASASFGWVGVLGAGGAALGGSAGRGVDRWWLAGQEQTLLVGGGGAAATYRHGNAASGGQHSPLHGPMYEVVHSSCAHTI